MPVYAIYGDSDLYCPSGINSQAMQSISNLNEIWVSGFNHIDLIANNGVELTDLITSCLPELSVPVPNFSLCSV